jgi:secretion/DNA translocation related TadE-like protein
VRSTSGVTRRAGTGSEKCCEAFLAERGSGAILSLGLVAVLGALLAGLLLLAQAGVMASRAATAADLSALAAADAARGLTSGEPCSVASAVAAEHGARTTGCGTSGEGIVEVSTELLQPFLFGPATGRARAGPPP